MDPTPADPPPGCLVLLLGLSSEMNADVVTGRGESVAFAAARQLADELVEGLVRAVAGGYAVGAIDVAVLGYRTAADGTPQLLSLLPGGDPKPRLVPLPHLVGMPAEARAGDGQPRKWAVLPPCGGGPCPAAALAHVYQMVSVWLTGRFAARPPVVIHCTATGGLDEAYFRTARSLGLLATAFGPARLMHYVFDATNDEVRHARLLDVSGELPDDPAAGKVARRALGVNDWDVADQWDAIFTYAPRGDAVRWSEAGAAFDRERALWAEKMGNTPEQWEDAFAVDAATGAAAVADGASTGIYCRTWADQLSRRFLADRPDTRDPVSLNKWVNGLRTEWRAAIDYGNLNWSKQAKVDQVGAAATLLLLELGPADADGYRPWRAAAVGDASLFWVRDGRLRGTFPVVAADQFGSAPFLVRSNPGFRTSALAAEGACAPGDRFVLATDAVAARLFKSTAVGPGPDWDRFETMTDEAWRAEMDALRRANDMVNDDCTLVVLRVSGGAEAPGAGRTHRTEPAAAAGAAPESEPQSGSTTAPHPPEEVSADAGGRDGRAGEVSRPTDDLPIGADVGDLMIDLPRAPPAHDNHKADDSAEEPPPAARDGFPESTDPRV